MKPITEFALELATKAHAGQKRKDGKDYITHPIAVAEIVNQKFADQWASSPCRGAVCSLALLHDVAEDTEMNEEKIVEEFVRAGYFAIDNEWSAYHFLDTLCLLNKSKYATYTDYIVAIKNDPWAALIKRADLTHNLSDLKPGSLRDKYELALHILS